MNNYDLKPIHDSRKSFYGKARVEEYFDYIVLYSYKTLVCRINIMGKENIAEVLNLQSQTTLRHVKEFLLQNGFKAINKKQITEDYFCEEAE